MTCWQILCNPLTSGVDTIWCGTPQLSRFTASQAAGAVAIAVDHSGSERSRAVYYNVISPTHCSRIAEHDKHYSTINQLLDSPRMTLPFTWVTTSGHRIDKYGSSYWQIRSFVTVSSDSLLGGPLCCLTVTRWQQGDYVIHWYLHMTGWVSWCPRSPPGVTSLRESINNWSTRWLYYCSCFLNVLLCGEWPLKI